MASLRAALGSSVALCLLSVTGAWMPVPRPAVMPMAAARSSHRASDIRAETPFRTDDQFDYFRRKKSVSVTLSKPLGAVLGEAAPAGVKIEEMQEGGSAAESGLLKKGDRLIEILDADVSTSDFDSVMSMLIDAPEEVALKIERNVIIKKPKEVKPDPVLTIKGGPSGDVAMGSSLRLTIQSSGVDLYKGMNKLTNCGGAGQCSLCMVDVVEGSENLSPLTAVEQKRLAKKPPTYRMACQALIEGDVTVEIP